MIETCRICLDSNDKIVCDVEDYLSIIQRIAQIDLIFDQRLSSKVCDDCVNDLFNADLLRDMLLKCNAPLKTEETEGEVIEMYEEIPMESIQEEVKYEEDFKVPQSPIKIQFQCHKCSTAFLSMGLLIRHLAKEHSGRKALVFKQKKFVPPKKDEKESRYVCHRCNIPVQKLGPHMSSVHPNDPLEFKCKFCGRIFSKLSVLQKHMFDHHLPMHICEECGATFKRKARLIDHKVSYHLKLKAFVCDYCDAKFARKPGLKAHIRTHTGSKPYKCKYCDKAYSHYSDYRTHDMSHTGEWKHRCPICNKGFYKPSTLKNHMRIH